MKKIHTGFLALALLCTSVSVATASAELGAGEYNVNNYGQQNYLVPINDSLEFVNKSQLNGKCNIEKNNQ